MAFTDDDLKRLKEDMKYQEKWIPALLSRLEAAENCLDSVMHESECVLSLREAGEPTPDGGYRTMYAGQWYQTRPVDDTPRCNCTLAEKLDAWGKAAGK